VNGGLLVSYHFLRENGKDPVRGARRLRKVMGRLPFVLDSGAFSAQSIGAPIPLLEYGRFIKQHGKLFSWIAALDVIGDPDRTRANWRALMRQRPVVPTVHLLTDLAYLDFYLNQGVNRLAIGGMVGNRRIGDVNSNEGRWLTEALQRCADRGVAVHGFGVVAANVLDLYSWDSADASTAVRAAMFRKVLLLGPDGTIKHAEPSDFPAAEAALLFSEFEVYNSPSASRRARVRRNVRTLMWAAQNTGLKTMFHAVCPNDRDEDEVRNGVLDFKRGVL